MTKTGKPVFVPTTASGWMDAMRLVAACAVCFGHVRNLLIIDYRPGIGLVREAFYFASGFGDAAVILFFVLSGYWIGQTVCRNSANDGFVRTYLIDRLSRLWLVSVPAILLTALADCAGLSLAGSTLYDGTLAPGLIAGPAALRLDALTMFGNLLFLQGVAVPTFGSNGPLWSLAFEFWYYLAFPALWLMLRHRRVTALIVALPVLALDHDMLLGFGVWLVGAALAALLARPDFHVSPRRAWLLMCAALPAFIAALAWHRIARVGLFDPALALSFAAVLFCLLRTAPSFPRLLVPLARLGASSSYSIYAIHMPLAVLTAALILPARRLEPSLSAMLLVAGITIALVIAGYAFSRLTEAHTPAVRQWLRALALNRPAKAGRT